MMSFFPNVWAMLEGLCHLLKTLVASVCVAFKAPFL